jgi:hypothetical protein
MKPTVLISSTYSDLKDVRHVLHGFIVDDLGYNCLISEHHDFPVTVSTVRLTTVEKPSRRILTSSY